jgi:hypothetical protein
MLMHSPFTVVIGTRGYAGEVSAPRARGVRIRSVKVPDQNNIQHDHQREGGQPETPRHEGVSSGRRNSWVEDRAHEEAHQETTQVCEVVNV